MLVPGSKEQDVVSDNVTKLTPEGGQVMEPLVNYKSPHHEALGNVAQTVSSDNRNLFYPEQMHSASHLADSPSSSNLHTLHSASEGLTHMAVYGAEHDNVDGASQVAYYQPIDQDHQDNHEVNLQDEEYMETPEDVHHTLSQDLETVDAHEQQEDHSHPQNGHIQLTDNVLLFYSDGSPYMAAPPAVQTKDQAFTLRPDLPYHHLRQTICRPRATETLDDIEQSMGISVNQSGIIKVRAPLSRSLMNTNEIFNVDTDLRQGLAWAILQDSLLPEQRIMGAIGGWRNLIVPQQAFITARLHEEIPHELKSRFLAAADAWLAQLYFTLAISWWSGRARRPW